MIMTAVTIATAKPESSEFESLLLRLARRKAFYSALYSLLPVSGALRFPNGHVTTSPANKAHQIKTG